MTGRSMTAYAAFAVLGALLGLFVFAAATPAQPSMGSWQLAFAHDAEGKSLEGSKEALIEAVRSGLPVRVYYAGRRVEHLADSHFLTVFGGEVFAQLDGIETQAPRLDSASLEPATIAFREPGVRWRAILSTSGEFRGLADGREPGLRRQAARWFVQR